MAPPVPAEIVDLLNTGSNVFGLPDGFSNCNAYVRQFAQGSIACGQWIPYGVEHREFDYICDCSIRDIVDSVLAPPKPPLAPPKQPEPEPEDEPEIPQGILDLNENDKGSWDLQPGYYTCEENAAMFIPADVGLQCASGQAGVACAFGQKCEIPPIQCYCKLIHSMAWVPSYYYNLSDE